MRKRSLTLVAIALTGWAFAAIAHVRRSLTDDTDERSAWTLRRNQCLLVSSISMNALVLLTVYRYVKKVASIVGR